MNYEQKYSISNEIDKEFLAIELIYVGSTCRFSYPSFIKNARGKSPTLCVVKTTEGRVWGGYTNIPWTNDDDDHSADRKTFVFTFNQNGSV